MRVDHEFDFPASDAGEKVEERERKKFVFFFFLIYQNNDVWVS